MSMIVKLEYSGRHLKTLRAYVAIGFHWKKFGNETFGLQCISYEDLERGFRLRTQVRLTAVGGDLQSFCDDPSATEGTILKIGGFFAGRSIVTRLDPPRVFPKDLLHEFVSSQGFESRIDKEELSIVTSFGEEANWRRTRDKGHWGVFADRESRTSIPSLMLSLKFQTVFHPGLERSAPIEFEWGTPGVVSSGFETKRSKH